MRRQHFPGPLFLRLHWLFTPGRRPILPSFPGRRGFLYHSGRPPFPWPRLPSRPFVSSFRGFRATLFVPLLLFVFLLLVVLLCFLAFIYGPSYLVLVWALVLLSPFSSFAFWRLTFRSSFRGFIHFRVSFSGCI